MPTPAFARRSSTFGPMPIRQRVTCTMPPLHHPCVDPRFGLVLPKGRARTWNQMGNGNWAASADYAKTILSLDQEARAFTSATSNAESGMRDAGCGRRLRSGACDRRDTC